MSRGADKLRTSREFDRRVKLTDEQRAEIKELYTLPEWSTRKLAAKYGVSKRSIQFVLDPEKLEASKQRRAERGGSKIYYDKNKWRETQREHREYKRQLKREGKI